MNPKVLEKRGQNGQKNRLALLQKQLRNNAFKNYLKVLRALLSQHQDKPFLGPLSDALRDKDYERLLVEADSLSAQTYADATEHFVANQFSLLIRKYPWKKDQVNLDPEGMALWKFRKSERKCKLINRRFRLLNKGTKYEGLLQKMRDVIKYVIGNEPNLERIMPSCGFGAGASLGVHGQATHVAKKLSQLKWTCTPCTMTYAYWGLMGTPQTRELLYEWKGGYFSSDHDVAFQNFMQRITTVTNNKLSFVSKTAKTHRVIAVEPLLNGFVQTGIELELKKLLLRVGIDLSDQSINQRLAREGSLDDSDFGHVTIDLESASDSISIEMVRSLLPPAWFAFLNCVRSPEYELDGTIKRYQKFCSMGNGFCFPLETLIFYACVAVCKDSGKAKTDFSVYGDDIIVRKRISSEVLANLKLLGFKTNRQKTFLNGPFRESCGADYFDGVDVRPYTLDNSLDSLQELFKWLNLTTRNQLATDFFWPVRDLVLSWIPSEFQMFRPQVGPCDTGINCSGLEFMSAPTVSWKRDKYLWKWKELKHSAVRDDQPYASLYLRSSVDMYAILSGVPSQGYQPEYTMRRKTRTTLVTNQGCGATSQWLPPHPHVVRGASMIRT